jgi:DNA-binding MarR family transcriptional regulator
MSDSSKRLLSTLMVLGAQSPERALALEELAGRMGIGSQEVESELKQLVDAGYARVVRQPGTSKVYLTGTGIITASSTYS